VPGAPDALQPARDRLGRLDLQHEVDGAHVDPELERRGGDQAGDLAELQELFTQNDATRLGKARLQYFWINKGPWSALDNFKAFIPGVPAEKPKGANFYPEDMTKQDFETWVASLSKEEQEQAKSALEVAREGITADSLNVAATWRWNESYNIVLGATWMPFTDGNERFSLDLRYVDNWSMALDLSILWRTVEAVLRGSGAY
jgi:hypothetical protein